jgi:hypothetical protein
MRTGLSIGIVKRYMTSFSSRPRNAVRVGLSVVLLAALWIIGLVICSVSALPSDAAAPYQYAGTRRMAEKLTEIWHAQDWQSDPFKNKERSQHSRDWLATNRGNPNEWSMRITLANQLLEAGQSAEAVQELERGRELGRQKGTLSAVMEQRIHDLLGIAYLRMGEQENCIHNHNAESCLFPIRGSGIHIAERGARGAIREYTAFLENNPIDLSARWLLNIAYMTLGQHPEQVPPEWLIPSTMFDSEYDIKRFYEIAPRVGLDITGHAGGSIAEDFDGDGLIDLMVSSHGPADQLRFFHNNGDGTFTERTKEAGLLGETGGLNLVHADYNNDGHPDVLVLRGGWLQRHGEYPMSLLRNNGNGTFDDVTEEAGLLMLGPTQTAAWADYDNDGRLDLFVGREEYPGESRASSLYHNNGDGTFADIAPILGMDHLGVVKGVAWGDYNNDGWPDLYISRIGQPNLLFRNDGRRPPASKHPTAWSFTDVTRQAGVAEPIFSLATWFWDYDNDGWLDLLVAPYLFRQPGDIAALYLQVPNRAEYPRLYHNNHDGTFSDVTKQVKLDRVILTMGANFGDLDNDGWLDCYFGTGAPDYRALLPNRMFRNNGGKVFQDVTTSGGFGHLQKGHAVSFADFNNDGDLDVFEVIGGYLEGDTYQSILFENPGHGNHWISLDLEGVKTNRSAIGARVRVRVETPEGERDIFRSVTAGGSFGDSPFRIHIGLGQANAIHEVEVRWPTSRTVQTFRDLPMDQSFKIREGESQPVPLHRKSFSFSSAHAPQAH